MILLKPAVAFAIAATLVNTGIKSQAATTNLVPSADTTLFESATDNSLGATPSLISGTIATGKRDRALIKFDLTRLPAGATVTSAQLSLKVVKAGAGPGSTFTLHRVLKDWGEGSGNAQQGNLANAGDGTWNNRFHPATAWTSPGAGSGTDYATAASASTPMDASGTYTFGTAAGMVANVQSWFDNPGTNFGWIIISQDEETSFTARRIGSREDAANTPILVVGYTVAAPPSPPIIAGISATSSQLVFSFTAESNRTYLVRFRDSLSPTNWSELTNFAPQPFERTIQLTNPITPTVPQRFFQVGAQ